VDKSSQDLLTKIIWSELIKDISLAATDAETIPEAMQKALELIRSYMQWEVGHVFYRSSFKEGELISTSIWSTSDPDRWESFKRETSRIHKTSGIGLPGDVMETGRTVIYRDLAKVDFLRLKIATELGLKAGIAFPVFAGNEIAAVLEFFSTETIETNKTLLDGLKKVGNKLGRVVERRRAEAEIRASQQQLADAQRIARMGSWEWNIRTDEVSVSEELFRIFGSEPKESPFTYETFLDHFHPDDREQVDRLIQDAYQKRGEFDFESRILRPDQEVRYLNGHAKVILDSAGKAAKMIGTSQDVTEQKQVQEKLRASEELIRKVVTAAPLVMWTTDRDGQVILAEGRELSSFGVKSQDLPGNPIRELIQSRPEIRADIEKALSGQEIVAEINTETATYESRYAPIRNNEGEISGVIGVLININDRIRIEEALRASETRFRTIFEGSAVGIAMIDLDRRFLIANPALLNMLDYSAAELWGKDLKEVIHPLDSQQNELLLEAMLSGDQELNHTEQRLLKKDGSIIWVNSTLSLTRRETSSPRFAILMVEDISLRKQMEAELAEVQRRLIASREKERLYLAQELHDDPLQELYGLMYQLEDVSSNLPDGQAYTELRDALTSVNRIINKLRNISRELRPPTLSSFGLEGAIRELCDRFQDEHPELKMRLDLMYDGQRLSEEVRMTLYRILQQALNNIVRHAQASNVSVRLRYNHGEDVLEVEDNGVGFSVPPRWVRFVREGHFGLAGAAERAETINGRFQVISAPGKGTRVRVTVPFESNPE
jgi:PAS domain S-box-containing protein